MKEELLKLLESKGLTIKFEGYWTGEDYVDTEYLKNTYPEILELFGEDVVCEGASEEAITKAILGLLGYLSENGIESVKCRIATMNKFEDMNYHTESSDFSSGNFDKYIITENKGE